MDAIGMCTEKTRLGLRMEFETIFLNVMTVISCVQKLAAKELLHTNPYTRHPLRQNNVCAIHIEVNSIY